MTNRLPNQDEIKAAETAASMGELVNVAMRLLHRMTCEGYRVVSICGPMTTGGLGSFEANMARYKHAVKMATQEGFVVFDLSFFQPHMDRILGVADPAHQNVYRWEILLEFLVKVFESGYITKGFFLPMSRSSIGASWEKDKFTELGIPIRRCPAKWLD